MSVEHRAEWRIGRRNAGANPLAALAGCAVSARGPTECDQVDESRIAPLSPHPAPARTYRRAAVGGSVFGLLLTKLPAKYRDEAAGRPRLAVC